MAEFFFRGMLVCIMLFGFGMWGIRKLLRENPMAGRLATRGVMGLIKRFFF